MPRLRRPLISARRLWGCHPVNIINCLIDAPLTRCNWDSTPSDFVFVGGFEGDLAVSFDLKDVDFVDGLLLETA